MVSQNLHNIHVNVLNMVKLLEWKQEGILLEINRLISKQGEQDRELAYWWAHFSADRASK